MKTVLLALLEQYADWEAAYVSTGIHMLGQGKIVVKAVSLSEEPVTSAVFMRGRIIPWILHRRITMLCCSSVGCVGAKNVPSR